MTNIITVILLSILPISELRGAIPLGIGLEYNPLLIFVLAVFFNSIIILPLFFFLDHIHTYLIKFSFYHKIFTKYINKARRKVEHLIGTEKEALGLYLLTAIPLPMTGAYSATILAWFFNIKRTKAIKAIVLGVFTAGVIVTLASMGIIKIFF
ncbi:ligand-binding protein SH3 [archaeon]|nr:ligand-binding protein SH3 [archaeon]|tara:strand:+ start:594 stop:1052 length:459 start_codon:yes stop_codon:yes gene_type:complete